MSRIACAILLFVALVQCQNLERLSLKTWYPVASNMDDPDPARRAKCEPVQTIVEGKIAKCPKLNLVTIKRRNGNSTIAGLEVNSFEEAVKVKNLTCEHKTVMAFRFFGNYAVVYTRTHGDNMAWVDIAATKIPTEEELREALKSIPEIKRDKLFVTACDAEKEQN